MSGFCPFSLGGMDLLAPEEPHNSRESQPSTAVQEELDEEPPALESVDQPSAANHKGKKKARTGVNKTSMRPTRFNPPRVDDETAEALKKLTDSGLHGKLATAQLHSKTMKIENEMSAAEKEHEREVRNEQLSAIFALMQAQGDKFGVHDKEDLVEQMKLYSV